MALRIGLAEGPFLADVGFGGLVMTAPLALETGRAQPTPHEPFRLVDGEPGWFTLQAQVGPDGGAEDWRTLYRFDLTAHADIDYEPLNWFVATHAASPFPRMLMAARAEPRRRLALADARLTIRRKGEPPAERTLQSLGELGEVLTGDFGLTLPPGFERIGPKLGLS
jgi:N-hydroxyarylamine O-acetyltransferase